MANVEVRLTVKSTSPAARTLYCSEFCANLFNVAIPMRVGKWYDFLCLNHDVAYVMLEKVLVISGERTLEANEFDFDISKLKQIFVVVTLSDGPIKNGNLKITGGWKK